MQDFPLPPADFAASSLPVRTLPTGTLLFRCHLAAFGPVFFGPAAGLPPQYRFDSASGSFGVLYAAENSRAPIVETLLRRPDRKSVSRVELARRALAELVAARPLTLVDCTGANLSRLGTTAELFTGSYRCSQAWAEAFFAHPQTVDGLVYPSRHNPALECIALFERPDLGLSHLASTALPDLAALVGAILDEHGKALL